MASISGMEAQALAYDVLNATKEKLEGRGVDASLGRVRTEADGSGLSVTIRITSADAEDIRAADWDKWAPVVDLPTGACGKAVRVHGRTFTLVGIALNRKKYPVTVKGLKGGQYKLPAEPVKRALLAMGKGGKS